MSLVAHLLAVLFLLSVPASPAQETAVGAATVLSVDTLRADFAELYSRLQSAHADLYVHRPRSEYDALYQTMLDNLREPRSVFDASVLFQRFVAYGKVAHANIAFPVASFDAYRDRGGRTFPVYLRIHAGRAFVGENRSGLDALKPGDQILALDGVPMAQWLERTAAHISADTPYIAHSLLEFTFPRYMWLERGEVASFDLRLRTAAGRARTVTVPARSRDEQRATISAQAERFALDSTQRIASILDDEVAYLRPGPFYNVEDPQAPWDTDTFVAFVDAAFEEFLRAGLEHLIIDLRQNPGGDNSFSDPMLAWIADKPFRFCSAFLIRSSDEAAASNQARLDQNPDATEGVSRLFAKQYARVPRGQSFAFEIPLVAPRGGQGFEGQVYVLVDRHSYSNSVNVAAIVQDYGLGLVAGEKTADMATTYGAMESFTLTGSGIVVNFPKAHIIRPSGEQQSDGVTPDWPIPTPIVAATSDIVLDRLLQKIRAH